MKKFSAFLIMCVSVLLCGASMVHATACGTTTVSATVVDLDNITWANGTYIANLVLPPQVFNSSIMACTTSGGTFNLQYSGTLSSSGVLSVALPQNVDLAPAGSQWAITFCPNALKGCYTYTAVIYGSTQSLSTGLQAVLPGPRFNYQQPLWGYNTEEITSTVPTGTHFYNTTTSVDQVYNGSGWATFNPGGASTDVNGNLSFAYNTLFDDFCGNTPATTTTVGQLGWDITVLVTGTNPVAAVASVAGHPCLITLTTDTTATNGVGIYLGHAVGVLFPGASTNWQSEHIAKINQITSGSYRIGFGTVDSATAIPTNGIYFRFLNGTDTFIEACSDSSGTETCTATTVTPTAGDYVDFLMNSKTTGTVNFTVTDVTTPATSTISLCASGCTGTATLPTVVLSPMFNLAETGSSAADVLTVDSFAYQQANTR